MTTLSLTLRPVLLANHPQVSQESLLSTKADPNIVLIRAYRVLVTDHNVDPALAKQLLGLAD